MLLEEWDRVLSLPRKPPPPEGLDLTHLFARPGGEMQLRPIQSQALYEISQMQGLVAEIGVGWGKTLVTLLTPSALHSTTGRWFRSLLLIPPKILKEQFWPDVEEYARHFWIPRDVLTVLPHSKLSHYESSTLLTELAPEVVIIDECHAFRNFDAARTKRLHRYFEANPETRLVAMSGTLSSRSLKDFAHFNQWALGAQDPLPHGYLLDRWCEVTDVDAASAEAGYLSRLQEQYGGLKPREAVQEHLQQSWGFVQTCTHSVDVPLYLDSVTIETPEEIQNHLKILEDLWELPDGTMLTMPPHKAEAARHLSQGFHYYWVWPDGEPDVDWLAARSAWGSACRTVLNWNKPELDSPYLVQLACESGKPPTRECARAWRFWSVEKQKPDPPTASVWLDSFLIDYAVDWLQSNPGGLLWYEHDAVGTQLAERGVVTYTAEFPPPRGIDRHSCAMSMAHSEGQNLQAWNKALVLSPPRSGKLWEQMLGRLHRALQEEPVYFEWMAHTQPFREAMYSAKRDARYKRHGQPQKLLLAERRKNHE